MHLTDYLVTFSRSTRLILLCVSRQLEKDSLQSIQHLLQVITLSVEGPMKSKAARRFPTTTCQGHFSLKNTLETRLSRDARKSSRSILSPDTLFFFSLCYQRNGKVRGEVFSSLVSVRACSAKFLIGSETLVRKRAKCFMHMCRNCKHLTLAVRFLKIGCQTKTFLKYLPRLSLCYEISVSPV